MIPNYSQPLANPALNPRTLGQRFLDDSEFVFERVFHRVKVLVQVSSMDVVVSLRHGSEWPHTKGRMAKVLTHVHVNPIRAARKPKQNCTFTLTLTQS